MRGKLVQGAGEKDVDSLGCGEGYGYPGIPFRGLLLHGTRGMLITEELHKLKGEKCTQKVTEIPRSRDYIMLCMTCTPVREMHCAYAADRFSLQMRHARSLAQVKA